MAIVCVLEASTQILKEVMQNIYVYQIKWMLTLIILAMNCILFLWLLSLLSCSMCWLVRVLFVSLILFCLLHLVNVTMLKG